MPYIPEMTLKEKKEEKDSLAFFEKSKKYKLQWPETTQLNNDQQCCNNYETKIGEKIICTETKREITP